MNLKSLTSIVFFLTIGILSCKKDQTQPLLTDNPLKTEQDLKVQSVFKDYAEKKNTAGLSIGILKNDQEWYYGYGEIIKGLKAVPDKNTVFEIGSITKTFTATLLIDLFSKLNLNLDEPVNNFLPSQVPLLILNGKKVCIKHLLNHTSGLPRLPEGFDKNADPSNPYKNYDSTQVYEALRSVKLESEPGEKFSYSNLGMAIAGLILERKSGKSYSDYLTENIVKPLGLERTKAVRDYSENLARGYNAKGKETSYWDLNGYAGAGCIYSSTKDLLNYAKAIINPDKTGKAAVLKKVTEVTFTNSEFKIASAWFYLRIHGVECLVHDGGTGGFRSFIYIAPSRNMALVVLANNGNDDIGKVANELAEKLFE